MSGPKPLGGWLGALFLGAVLYGLKFWRWVRLLFCRHDNGVEVAGDCVRCKTCGRCLAWWDG